LPGLCRSMKTRVSDVSSPQVLPDPQAVPRAPLLPLDRVASIDWLRVLAATGIIWFHTETAPHRTIGYAGLPIFLLIFFSLITRQDATGSTVSFLKRRYKRLLCPWLFWSAVYGFGWLMKAVCTLDSGELWRMFSIETLLAGTNIHLWYLPYAFIWGFVVYEVNRRTSKIDHVTAVIAALVLAVLTLAVCEMGITRLKVISPFPQWGFGLTAIPLGFAVGRCLAIPARGVRKVLLASISLIVLIECLILQSFGFGVIVIPYAIATAAVSIAYGWEMRRSTFLAALAPLTFGVYLIHPMVAYVLYHSFVPRSHYGISIALTACISALVTYVLMKTPVKRFL
jgi:surface polysaccharide O-acyltransferase-like enzyme